MDANESQIKEHLSRLIKTYAGMLPNPSQATADLWKFTKNNDRRSCQLVRYCMSADSDYRTIVKAIKEISKRMGEVNASSLLDTLMPLLYRVSLIVYNKSHVPAIMGFSRTDDRSLSATAHEVLREISSKTPEVLKAHVQEICKLLQDEAPSAKKANDASAVDNLKACASFAAKYPKEIPQDRKFVQAMTSYALHGSPPEAAKYALSVIWAASEKKEMVARELSQKCIEGFEYGGEGFLSRLATLSQLVLLAPAEIDDRSTDGILDIAIKQVLLSTREPSNEPPEAYEWSSTMDVEVQAKCWALKILVNRVRSHPLPETLAEVASPVYTLLSQLIEQHGEISKANETPPAHKSRLRLLAARLYLKLCKSKAHDALLTPLAFNALSTVAQDPVKQVRAGFLQRLKKYLLQPRLPQRFYTIPFLLAFEPSGTLRSDTTTWIKSRAATLSSTRPPGSAGKASIVMESTFARLLSLLAHHPDYVDDADDLTDFSRYIIFFLQNVATEDNLSLIYHIAQRVKQCRDAVAAHSGSDKSRTNDAVAMTGIDDRLYQLSDLAQITIRKYEDVHNWTIQTLPGRVRLPSSLFTEIKSHAEAQRIAERNYLPEGVEAGVEGLLKATLKASRPNRKRKSEGGDHQLDSDRGAKKAKTSLPVGKASGANNVTKEKRGPSRNVAKTAKPKKKTQAKDEGSGERRRSGRVKEVGKNYVERDSDDDDEEMEMQDALAAEDEAGTESDTDAGAYESAVEEISEADEVDEIAAPELSKPVLRATPTKGPTKATVSPQATVKPKAKAKANTKQTRSRAASRGKRRAKAQYSDDELSEPPDSE